MKVAQIGEYWILEENHENGSETGPYGSVRADIHTGWIPQALGSLWDASRALKPTGKVKKYVFSKCFNISKHFLLFYYHPCTEGSFIILLISNSGQN